MKSLAYIFLAVLLFSTHLSYGQYYQRPEQSIKVSSGLVLLGLEGIPGMMFKTNYDFDKIPYIRLSPSLSVFSASRAASSNNPYQRTSAATLDLKLGMSPFKNQWSALYLNGGVSARYSLEDYQTNAANKIIIDPLASTVLVQKQSMAVGYIISADYELYFSEKWILAPEAAVQGYANGSTLAFFGIKGGIWL